jgi:predicted transcriptional regulator
MPRPKPIGPTDRELEILQLLWEHGPSTARDIHEFLNEKESSAYTSVLTILRIMHDKNLVNRDESSKSHVYKANFSKADMEEKLVKSFMDSVFGGSAMRLVTRALSVRTTSKEDKEKIRQILEKGGRNEEPD